MGVFESLQRRVLSRRGQHTDYHYDNLERELRRRVTGDVWEDIERLIDIRVAQSEKRAREEAEEAVMAAAEAKINAMLSLHNIHSATGEIYRQFVKKLLHHRVLRWKWRRRAERLASLIVGREGEDLKAALDAWRKESQAW
jgi:hypothetical protein